MPTTEHGDAAIALTRELMARPSVTPADAGCQEIMGRRLAAVGFACEQLRFGEVDNLWASRGSSGPSNGAQLSFKGKRRTQLKTHN